MINNLRFELSFKNIEQLEYKLNFCKSNQINNINIPCKGIIKKEFFNLTFEYIERNYKKFNTTYHYSLYHQYSKNNTNSYNEFINFIKRSKKNKKNEILLISGSRKKKNFDVLDVLNELKNKKLLMYKLGVSYNPYLEKYFNISSEKSRYEEKLSSGLIKSLWLQFGTDIELLKNEVNYLKNHNKYKKVKLFGSTLIPSNQFIARFKFRPWKGVHISNKYLSSLENFSCFTKDLIDFYIENNITPVIETDFTTPKQLDNIYSILKI